MSTGAMLVSSASLANRPPLAQELTIRRIGVGISQAELARRVGLHRTTISYFETGAMSPSDRTLEKIKAALRWR